MLYPWPRIRKCWLNMVIHFEQCCVIDSLLANNFHQIKEVNVRDNRKCFQDKKNQIIFVRRRFAWDKTQSTHRLTTPFDWKHLTRYFSSLVKITIWSTFTISEAEKKISVEILTARYRSYFHEKNLKELMQVKLLFYTYKYFMVNW